MKRVIFLLMIAMMTTRFSAFAQNEEAGLYVGDVSNSGCKSQTRSTSVRGNTILKLTRDGDNIFGELTDFYANCAISGISVECKEDDHTLNIMAEEQFEGFERAECICPYNVSFTLFNAKEEQYTLIVNNKNLGNVSFETHSVVEIDITTLEQAYEEGFEYPVKIRNFNFYELTQWIKPGEVRKPELAAFHYANYGTEEFLYLNYRLPKEFTYLDSQAKLDADSTLVLEIITDGSSVEESERIASLTMEVVNVVKPLKHLRLIHKVVAIGENGMMDKEVIILYEGDLNWVYDQVKAIELKDLSECRKNISSNVQSFISNPPNEGNLYDFTGRQIIGQPQRGMYIRNGRKIVIK